MLHYARRPVRASDDEAKTHDEQLNPGSGGAVDRDLKGCANGNHANIGKSAKPADQDCDGHTFHGVQVHGRTAGDGVGIGLKYDLAG